jgi:hypothetical protein
MEKFVKSYQKLICETIECQRKNCKKEDKDYLNFYTKNIKATKDLNELKKQTQMIMNHMTRNNLVKCSKKNCFDIHLKNLKRMNADIKNLTEPEIENKMLIVPSTSDKVQFCKKK